MLALGVLHDDIICLIQHIRTITVRTVIGKIQILIHIRVHRLYPLIFIRLIERFDQFLKISLGDCRIIFKYLDRHIFFEFPGKHAVGLSRLRFLIHCFFLRGVCRSASTDHASHKRCRKHQRDHSSFHAISPCSSMI